MALERIKKKFRANDFTDPNAKDYSSGFERFLAGMYDRSLIPLGKTGTMQKDMLDRDAALSTLYQKAATDAENLNIDIAKENRGIEQENREREKYDTEQNQSAAYASLLEDQYPKYVQEGQAGGLRGKDLESYIKMRVDEDVDRLRASQDNTSKQDAINERFKESRLDKLSTRLEKEKVPELQTSMNVVDGILSKYTENGKVGDIPGYGVLGGLKPGIITSEDGKELRANLQGMANILLQARSGAAVTDQEYRRFLKEASTGTWTTEASLLKGLKKMKQDIESRRTNILKGFRPDVVQEYETNEGNFSTPQFQTEEPPMDAKMTRLEELRRKKAGK